MKIMLANFAKMVNATGGLAKVTCAFANEMHRRGHTVTLVYCDEREGEFFYPVTDEVTRINLCHYKEWHAKFPLTMKLEREILRPLNIRKSRNVNDLFMERYLTEPLKMGMDEIGPDVIVASQPAATRMLINKLNVDIPIITMSHGDPEDYFHTYPEKEVEALGKSRVCQVLLPSYVKAIKSRFPDMQVEVIGNVVPQYSVQADLSKNKTGYKLLFVGRLNKNHKRPHLLIEAFSKIAKDYPAWNVELWGDIDNKNYVKYMKALIKRNGLENRVIFKGVTNDVQSVLQTGDIFVLPSAYEGFPLALTEAMSMGLPVVAYESCTGANELIINSVNGLLCRDGVDALAEGIKNVMSDSEKRHVLGDEACKSMSKYNAENIWHQWEILIESIVKE
ncbi:glycosyltransferase [Selenomonas ruminantium]|uniref:Glycosyltransferase involved in cell wall bisynthesis n=1 Tax=Selenomonas ruminantium TaxID=971 RepID=A0A1K1NQB6_SELRU|nr:glycosyltransferase [Selenomonas ruminantium]SFW37481.1 Glycosyltransferase involved in cell wall bisynthesis [Selenomonas ruminantium]